MCRTSRSRLVRKTPHSRDLLRLGMLTTSHVRWQRRVSSTSALRAARLPWTRCMSPARSRTAGTPTPPRAPKAVGSRAHRAAPPTWTAEGPGQTAMPRAPGAGRRRRRGRAAALHAPPPGPAHPATGSATVTPAALSRPARQPARSSCATLCKSGDARMRCGRRGEWRRWG